MADRAKYIQLGIQNGVTDLSTIRNIYNTYAEGGSINKYDGKSEPTQQMSFMDKATNFVKTALFGPAEFIKDKFMGTTNYLTYDRTPRVIPLNNNVQQLSPSDETEYILYNDFSENNSNNVRKARDFKHTTDTLIGDRKVPLSNLPLFQGVVNNKLVIDSLKNFNDNTIVVPVRSQNKGKIKKLLPKRHNWVPAVTTTNDTIYIKDTDMMNKVVLGDENGDSYFIEHISAMGNDQIERLNQILSKNPKYYVLPDNGRYKHTSEDASVRSYLNPLDSGKGMFIIGKGKRKRNSTFGDIAYDIGSTAVDLLGWSPIQGAVKRYVRAKRKANAVNRAKRAAKASSRALHNAIVNLTKGTRRQVRRTSKEAQTAKAGLPTLTRVGKRRGVSRIPRK